MSSMLKGITAAVLALVMLGVGDAHADRRAFTHTYEYMTMPQGNLELEFYNTQESATFDTDSPSEFEQMVEVEYGITDHWDFSIYQVFGGGEDGTGARGFGYKETKLRTRYRFAERGEWPVDVLLYFEIIKPFGIAAVGLEPKLVLARDFGPVTLAFNAVLELEPEEELDVATGETEIEYEIEPEFALGVTYEASPAWKLGVEAWGALETFVETDEYAVFAGPALSWAPSPKLWISVTPAFKVLGADDEPEFNFRMILGLDL